MIDAFYDPIQNLLTFRFRGVYDLKSAEEAFSSFQEVVPLCKPRFKLLVDFSDLQSMEVSALEVVKKIMDFVNAHGVSEIVRILPDPAMDLGFSILSVFHYSRDVKIRTVPSLDQVIWESTE